MPPPPVPTPAAAAETDELAVRAFTVRAVILRTFAAETARLAGSGFAADTRLAVAVSGGGDSLALMWLAAEAFPGRVQVLSVDHGLRAEAAAECETVAQLAAGIGLPQATLRLDAPLARANVQAEARRARYAAMARWMADNDIRYLLTAHHADDQAETILMRLARGSGVAGLAGIRTAAEIERVRVLRPLLGWRRGALRELLPPDWTPADDPGNRDSRYDRTGIRALLAREPLLDPERLAACAAHLADVEDALGWAAERAWQSRRQMTDSGLLLDPEGLPPELRRRLLLRGLATFGVEADGPSVARLLGKLAAGGTSSLGTVCAAVRPDGRWRLARAPVRRPR